MKLSETKWAKELAAQIEAATRKNTTFLQRQVPDPATGAGSLVKELHRAVIGCQERCCETCPFRYKLDHLQD